MKESLTDGLLAPQSDIPPKLPEQANHLDNKSTLNNAEQIARDAKLKQEYYNYISHKFRALKFVEPYIDQNGEPKLNEKEKNRMLKVIENNLSLIRSLELTRNDLEKMDASDPNYNKIVDTYKSNKSNIEKNILRQFFAEQNKKLKSHE